MIKVNSNVTTIELTGSEEKVQFAVPYPYYWVLNASGAEMYASMSEGITANADGVVPVPVGGAACTMHGTAIDTVYLLGTSSCVVMGTYSAFCPFKVASGGGDSGGAVDEQARADLKAFKTAVNAKLATNAPYKVLRGSGSASNGSATISFSSAFSIPPSVVCTPLVNDATIAINYSCFVSSVTASAFTVKFKKMDSAGSVSAVTGSFYWIAMGG